MTISAHLTFLQGGVCCAHDHHDHRARIHHHYFLNRPVRPSAPRRRPEPRPSRSAALHDVQPLLSETVRRAAPATSDAALGLDDTTGYSHGVQALVALATSKLPIADASLVLEHLSGVPVPPATIPREAQRQGQWEAWGALLGWWVAGSFCARGERTPAPAG